MSKPSTWVVIPAAGVGARVGAAKPKQYIAIDGEAMLLRSLRPFLEADFVEGVVLALSANDTWWPELNFSHPKLQLCIGGTERADSVLAGLSTLNLAADSWVMVHDAARPCITGAQLQLLFEQLQGTEGGLWAIPVADTLKQASADQHSVATIDRNQIWRAQTPQMFKFGELQQALASALAQGLSITDEASAIEYSGGRPTLVEGFNENIKVTYPSDVALAEFYLKQQHK